MTRQEAVKPIRQRLELSQEDFARAIDVTVSTVNRWENLHIRPSRLAWKAIQTVAASRGVALTPEEQAAK